MKKKPGIVNKKKISNRLFLSSLLMGICFVSTVQADSALLKKTLPKEGKMQHNKPKGKGWINLLYSPAEWNFENNYWQFTDSSFHGEILKLNVISLTKKMWLISFTVSMANGGGS